MTVSQKLVAAFAVLSVFTVIFYCLRHESGFWPERDESLNNVLVGSDNETRAATNSSSLLDTVDQSTLTELQEKLLNPKPLLAYNDNDSFSFLPHQFLHLHHMKTGGTSLERLIRCGTDRLALRIPFKTLHECSVSRYRRCRTGEDAACLNSVKEAAIMSYCAPVSDLQNRFEWLDVSSPGDTGSTSGVSPPYAAVTVLRHPIDRIWSMYRYQTEYCYQCRTLKEVYEEIDNSTNLTMMSDNVDRFTSCSLQLLSHQTRNLLLLDNDTSLEGDDDLLVQQAVLNLKSLFTITGLTDELKVTAQMIGKVFPWLAETVSVEDIADMVQVIGDDGSNNTLSSSLLLSKKKKKKDSKCHLEHTNKSPRHNPCGKLPPTPDAETAKIILEHNQLDLHLYEKAVEHFQLQRAVLGL